MILTKKSNNLLKELTASFDSNGIHINKNDIEYIKNVLNNDALSITFKTRLLVPDEIKSNTVTVSFNGPINYRYDGGVYYDSFINGENIKTTTQDVKVINNNGQRYLNHDVKMYLGKGRYSNLNGVILPRLNTFSFLVSDDMARKWFRLEVIK